MSGLFTSKKGSKIVLYFIHSIGLISLKKMQTKLCAVKRKVFNIPGVNRHPKVICVQIFSGANFVFSLFVQIFCWKFLKTLKFS